MVLVNRVEVVQDHQSPMADLIPNAHDNPSSQGTREYFNGVIPYQTGICQQERLERENSLKRQYLLSNKRSHVLRCSSLESFTTSTRDQSQSSVFISPELSNSHSLRQIACYQNGYLQQQPKFSIDSAQTSQSCEISSYLGSSREFPAYDPGSSSVLTRGYSDPRNTQSVLSNQDISVKGFSQSSANQREPQQRMNNIIPGGLSARNEYLQKLSSQSYSDISGTNSRHSFHASKTSSNDSAYKSMNSADNNFIFPDTCSTFHAATSYHASLPRRFHSDHFLRRTLSHEPRTHNMKPVIPRTSSYGEIESEYVTLDKRYVIPKYTPLSGVTEGVVCFQHPDSNSSPLTTSTNGSPFQGDYIQSNRASENDSNSSQIVSTSTNQIRLNESMLKQPNTVSESRKQASKLKTNSGSLRTVAETIGSLFSYRSNTSSPRNTASPTSVDSGTDNVVNIQNTAHMSFRRSSNEAQQENARSLTRSKSLSDINNPLQNEEENSTIYSDDEDGDEFGFLSYPISFLSSCTSTAMSKAKSPSPGNRIFTKRWRNKTNSSPAGSPSVAMWTPGPPGSCTWSSVSGRMVELRPDSILHLTEAERVALQKVALSKLQSLDIGCPVSIPKETGELPRSKKSPLSLKRRSKSVSASALDTMVKDGTAVGLVFGIPILRCVLNDRELDKRSATASSPGDSMSSCKMRTDSSDNFLMFRSGRKSSSSSQGSGDNGSSVAPQHAESLAVPYSKRTASSDSLSESECSHNTNSSLIDALSLSTSQPTSSRPSSLALNNYQLTSNSSGEAQVPYVVRSCFKHIETYGLQTLGIFRVGCSKKRVKQLREEFDCGREVKLTDEHNPHDVAALLKEFFRDLPEPLLTRELYLPFLYAERIKDEHTRHMAISLLISMLPLPNRDTLWALLRFLAVVSYHAADVADERGVMVCGNKMDSHNLATLFGPNILHRTKVSNEKELLSESVERVEQSKEVIEVVKDMIDNHHDLFEISASLRDDVLRSLAESSQETVNRILRQLANQNQIETDPESMCSVFEDSPVLYHATNSDADLIALSRKQAVTSHRPLRVTKSADDSLDSPISNILDPQFPESEPLSPMTIRDNHKSLPFNPSSLSQQQRFDLTHISQSPVVNRLPVLKMPYDPISPEVVLRSRLETGNFERPYSEGFNRNLTIPRPLYFREDSCSSLSSGLSSPLNTYCGTNNGQSGQWTLPTPPMSRAPSPKQLFLCASSSSTLIAAPASSQFNNPDDDCENKIPVGSAEWERERWKHWEKMAAQKNAIESEQETLV